ncbi:MAG TPA: Ig-like domain-containing protein [Vicinamibacterales bacterium]|nr:Ig-like domain-containing protein [Vicinamibacterales bacterium]
MRDDALQADIVLQANDTTWQAYNQYGGHSLYLGTPTRGYKVSYNRPFATRGQSSGYGTSNYLFYAEYPMIRWLESNGYNVKYQSGVDTDRFGTSLTGAARPRVLMTVGHDEYWSEGMRDAVEAARGAGVNIAMFTGNEVFWKTRWEASIDGTATPYRTLVTYKETHENKVFDPADPPTWTGTWRDPRFSPPADGGRPENSLTGQLFTVNRGTAAITVPGVYAPLRFWRNTAIAALGPNQSITLAQDTLGYEWDEDLDNGFRPAGSFQLSATVVNVPEHVQDMGSTYLPGTATHHVSMYRHSSGALVFGAGTVQWAWGLDTNHDTDQDFGSATPDPNIRQATLNLLADMGAQPATIQGSLIPAIASTDTTAPDSAITAPSPAASIPAGTIVTVTGTATDVGGGVVAGVEVSTDGGTSWRRATGTGNWSYSWVPGVLGAATLMSRATDDSGNIEQAPASVSVTITQANCPCSIWTPSLTTPWMVDSNDGAAVEVGLKFSTDVGGVVNGMRFYKATTNTGTHVGHLWTSAGTLLSTVTFSGESASGWQTATFASPAIIQPNTTYVISYYAPSGHYSDDQYFLGRAAVNQWPLHALKSTPAEPNGVFFYGASGFPNQTWFADSYSVDVIFTPDLVMPTVALTAPASGANISGNAVTVSATASDNLGIAGVQFKIDGANLNAEDTTSPYSIAWNSTLTANGTHTLTAVARDAAGNLTTSAPVTVSVFNADTVPPTVSISSPLNSATVRGTVTVVAAAADNQGVAGVQFMVDGALVGSELNAPPYSMTWDTSALANNSTHTLQARARDTSNNLTTSAANTVTISNPVGGAPAIDALVWTDQPNNQGTVTSPALSTSAGNELLLAFIATDYLGGTNTTVTGVTGGGLTWALVGRTNVQAGSSEVWRAFATAPISNATVVATLSQAVDSMMTVVSFSNVDTSGTNGSGAIGATASSNSNVGAPSATLTTTRNTSWVWGVGNDYDTATGRTVGANQALVHQYFPPVGDTYWVQRALNPTAASGTAVTLNDTAPNSDRYNFFIVEIKALNAPDVTPPTVSMTAPASGATVSGKTVMVSATASDNVGVSSVQFKLDGANLGAADTASPYTMTWDSTTVANGSHTFTAVASDAAGNTTTATAVTVTVNNDTTPPTVSITAPTGGSTVSGSATVSANASDDVGVVGVQFKLDGANLGAEVTAAPYNVSWNTTTAANGTHALTAVARDAAGNSTTSAPVSVTVSNVDSTPPTVSITAPANGATVAGTNVTVSATASDNVAVVGVQFLLDGTNLGPEDTATPYSTAWNTATAANGVHSLTARARDGAGNVTTSAAVTVTVSNDVTAPTVSMTAPAAGATVTGTAVTVSATASDNVGVAGVQFLLDGAAVGAEVTAAPYQIAWNSTSASNGSHTLSARARDAAGNQTTSAGVTVTVSNTPSTPPAIDAVKSVNRSTNATTLVSGAFSTTSANELLLAFISADYLSGNNTTVTGISGAGLTWVLVQRTNVQLGSSEIWRAFAPTALTNASVTATLSQSVAGSMTVVSFSNVDTTGTNGSGAVGAAASANSAGGAPSATLVTTRNNSLVFGVGNDFDNAIARTLGPNQTMVNQYLATIGDTYWAQRTTNPVATAGTSVTINDTAPNTDRFNLTICEIRSPQ